MINSWLWAVFSRQWWKALYGMNSSSRCLGPCISNSLNLESENLHWHK